MFFLKEMERVVRLEPRHLGPDLQAMVVAALNSQVEGTCSGQFGYILAVTEITHTDMATLNDDGTASFRVKFKAVVFKPFRGEVVDTVVTGLSKMGFFAELGPMQVFVSTHQIPEDMRFDEHSIPQKFVSDDGKVSLRKDDEVRVRIIGTRASSSEIHAIGSIKDDYLGPIS
eukprot:RCo005882